MGHASIEGVCLWPCDGTSGDKRWSAEFVHEGRSYTAMSWIDQPINLPRGSNHFGYVQAGSITLACGAGDFALTAGMYFSVPGDGKLTGRGSGHCTSQANYAGLFQIGGPIETTGRLLYIDGCSDTLLIPPVVRGDACLNFLHLPPNTRQSAHTHPSFRCGLVASGVGCCRTANDELPLVAGTTFSIEAGAIHSFHTDREPMRVIAFHPDSDCGPWHNDHPMVNRTLINGTAASRLSMSQRRISHSQMLTRRDREVS